MRFYTIIFIFIQVFCAIEYLSAHTSVAGKLASISEEDREGLSLFFEELILNEPFGYTIFGNKPVSFASYASASHLTKNSRLATCSNSVTLAQGKLLWERYGTLFRTSNFIFKFQASQNKRWNQIYLINKKAVHDVINKHLVDFQKILGKDITSEIILNELSRADRTVQEVLKDNDLLFGILLGFGYTNANAYQKRNALISGIKNTLRHPIYLQEDQITILDSFFFLFSRNELNASSDILADDPKAHFDNLLDSLITLQNKLHAFNEDDSPLNKISLPDFLAEKNDIETQNLLVNYKNTQQQIVQYLSQGNVMEVVLCKMEDI